MVRFRRLVVCIVCVAAFVAAVPAFALAEEGPEWSLTMDTAYASKHVWRGISVVDGDVLQTSTTLGYGGLSFNLWANRDQTGKNNNAGHFTEVHCALDYSWSWKPVDLSLGTIYYRYPRSNMNMKATSEYYGSLGLDVLLQPSLTVYHDIDEADGTYWQVAIGHTFEDVWEPSPAEDVSMSVEVGASVGLSGANYTDYYFGEDRSGFTDAMLSVRCPVRIGEQWTVTPFLAYARLLDKNIRSMVNDDPDVWGGLSATYCF